MTAIKLCGLTRAEDVEQAIGLEVEALGLNFVPGTPRALEPDRASLLSRLAKGRSRRIGVFRNAELDWLLGVCAAVELDAIQLHGDESPDFVQSLPLPVIKVLRGDAGGIEAAARYPECELLLDHPSGGGSGRGWDFGLTRELIRAGRRVWIAGGLSPENVRAAIEMARPYGVDASSGFESAPGIKDPERMRRFVAEARAAESSRAGSASARGRGSWA